MGRIVAIDYGLKRTGLAVTDPLKIIASPLQTVPTTELTTFLKGYHEKEVIEKFVIGVPFNLSGEETHATKPVLNFITRLKGIFKGIEIVEVDETYTSKMAFDAMITGGMKKKERRNKSNIDKVSATLILQSYLESQSSF